MFMENDFPVITQVHQCPDFIMAGVFIRANVWAPG